MGEVHARLDESIRQGKATLLADLFLKSATERVGNTGAIFTLSPEELAPMFGLAVEQEESRSSFLQHMRSLFANCALETFKQRLQTWAHQHGFTISSSHDWDHPPLQSTYTFA